MGGAFWQQTSMAIKAYQSKVDTRKARSTRPSCMLAATIILSAQLLLCGAQHVQAQISASNRNSSSRLDTPAQTCDSEMQMVMCSDIPATARYRAYRRECCRMHQPVVLTSEVHAAAAAAAAQQVTVQQQVQRGDLGTDLLYPPNYYFGKCTTQLQALVPAFNGNSVTIKSFNVPQFNMNLIKRVKTQVYSSLPQNIKNEISRIRTFNSGSGFQHPGTCAGPVELALMKQRLSNGYQITAAAKDSLLYGTGVKAKYYYNSDGSSWSPSTNCPADGYIGEPDKPQGCMGESCKQLLQLDGHNDFNTGLWAWLSQAVILNCEMEKFHG